MKDKPHFADLMIWRLPIPSIRDPLWKWEEYPYDYDRDENKWFYWDGGSPNTDKFPPYEGSVKIMTKIYEVELNTNQPTDIKELDVTDFLPPEWIDELKQHARGYGVDIEVKAIRNVERFIEIRYSRMGYRVIRTEWKGDRSEIKSLLDNGKIDPKVLDSCGKPGTPDYFCFKNEKDWFFVEGKNNNDVLRLSQALWIARTKYPVKLVFMEHPGIKTL